MDFTVICSSWNVEQHVCVCFLQKSFYHFSSSHYIFLVELSLSLNLRELLLYDFSTCNIFLILSSFTVDGVLY